MQILSSKENKFLLASLFVIVAIFIIANIVNQEQYQINDEIYPTNILFIVIPIIVIALGIILSVIYKVTRPTAGRSRRCCPASAGQPDAVMVFRFDLAARALGLSIARFRFRHFLFVLVFGVVVTALGLLGLAGMLLDELLQPRYRRARVERPLYIIATPRSGTTWLHRLLGLDPQFSSIKLYQTLLPAAVLMRLVQGVSRADRMVGSPLHRLAGWVSRAGFSGWEGIHHIGLDRSEEDSHS